MNKNDLVSRFREKTDKHWHPFMGVETKLEKRAEVAYFHYLFDRDEYWVIMTDSEGCFHKVGASFAYKDEAKRYVEWRNNHDYKKETDG